MLLCSVMAEYRSFISITDMDRRIIFTTDCVWGQYHLLVNVCESTHTAFPPPPPCLQYSLSRSRHLTAPLKANASTRCEYGENTRRNTNVEVLLLRNDDVFYLLRHLTLAWYSASVVSMFAEWRFSSLWAVGPLRTRRQPVIPVVLELKLEVERGS